MDLSRLDGLLGPVHALGVLAQTGSYTQAAQRLGLSKAAVSQRVSELERTLGVPLVLRTTRSVRLTEAGEQLVERLADTWARVDEALQATQGRARSPRGLIRVSAPVALGRQHLAPQLPAFLERWPEVRVELDLSDHLANLPLEGFDLAVRHTSHPPEPLVAVRLCSSRTLLVASRDHLEGHGRPQHPSELAGHACLTYLRKGPTVWRFEHEAAPGQEPQRVSVTVQGALRANNSEVLREATLAGLGLALLPDFSAGAALAAGRLETVLPRWRALGVFGEGIYALRPWSAQVAPATQALIRHLQAAWRLGLVGG